MYRIINHFTNFKNFTDVQMDLRPLTILIGKNGSGKTNLIEGIEVFAHLANGTPLHKFSDVGEGGECQVRGGLGNCVAFGATDFELNFNLETDMESPPRKLTIDYKIKIGRTVQHESILSTERLFVSEQPERIPGGVTVFSARQSGDVLEVECTISADGNHNISVSADRSVVSRYEDIIATSTASDSQKEDVSRAAGGISKHLRTAHIFDTNPKAMRGYKRIDAHAKLSRDGGNLSAVLYALKKNGKLEVLESITKIVQDLPEEPFLEIGFIETSANDVMLGFYVGDDETNKRLVDARMLSDGTLRMLAVLTALETVPEYSRIVVEEFDSGLHPSRVGLLVDCLYETAKRRKLNILVTTHNPAVMNAPNEEEMKSVVLCYRDKETGHSKLTPLMDIQDVDLMMLRGSLGDLVTGEVVEKYLSPDYRKKRAEIARKWKERYFP